MAQNTESVPLNEAFIQGILNGEFDLDLETIGTAVRQRQRSVALVASANIRVGDTVRANSRISPKYLRGATGVVTAIDEKLISVRIAEHVDTGRFSHNMRFPHGTLTKVEESHNGSAK